MQIVSLGDNLHEMLKPIFWDKEKNINDLSSAKFVPRAIKVKGLITASAADFLDFYFFIHYISEKIRFNT